MNIPNTLQDVFKCVPTATSKWIRLELSDGYVPEGFTSKRIAKWSPEGGFEFVIGSTAAGRAAKLDQTFRNILLKEGVQVRERLSTSGDGTVYPSFDLSDVDDAAAMRIFAAVNDAVRRAA